MRTTSTRAKVLLVMAAVFSVALVVLLISFYMNAQDYVMQPVNRHLFKDGAFTGGGTVLDRNGIILSSSGEGKRQYSSSSNVRRAMLHTVGDDLNFIATGVQKTFSSELVGYSLFWGVNTAKGNLGSSLKLTQDANVSAVAYEALNGRKGAIGVYNYKTGEIICSVSAPAFDVLNKPVDIETDASGKYDGIYVNKLLNGLYVPGSVFKVVTATSALENISDIRSRKFVCTGEYKAKGATVICHNEHGELDFDKALQVSCNVAFAQVAIELGESRLTSTVERLGLTSSLDIDRVSTAKGSFNVKRANDGEIGWAGVGQFTTMLNPLSVMTVMGAIANGGTAVKPYYVESITNAAEVRSYKALSIKLTNYMSLTTANTLKSLMRDTVVNTYGEYGLEELEICAKTGTAEVGGDKAPHSWFAGFSQRADFPYAFVVVVENGGSGYSAARPVASKVLKAIQSR